MVHRLPEGLHRFDVFRVLDVDRVHLLPHPVEPDLVSGFRERQDDILRPSDGERRDEGESPAVHHLLDLPQERVFRFQPLRVLPTRVRGLDEQGVAGHGLGAPDQVRRQRMQVAGEQGGLRAVHLEHRRAGDVARGMRRHLQVAHVHVVAEIDRAESAPRGPEVAVIEGSIESFRVRDLEGVLEQEVRHVRRRRREHDVDVLAAGDPGDHACVVQVRVADEHPVHGRGGQGVLGRIARQQAVIEEEGGGPLLQDHPQAADLRGAAEKLEIHPFRRRYLRRL